MCSMSSEGRSSRSVGMVCCFLRGSARCGCDRYEYATRKNRSAQERVSYNVLYYIVSHYNRLDALSSSTHVTDGAKETSFLQPEMIPNQKSVPSSPKCGCISRRSPPIAPLPAKCPRP